MKPVKTRSYRSPLRAERARANRDAILAAARALFVAVGYPRTSIARIAAEAEVSPDLVYLLFSSKRGLLGEVLGVAIRGGDEAPDVLEQGGPDRVSLETDQRRQIAAFVIDHAARVHRAAAIVEVMRSAASVDPAVAKRYDAILANFRKHLSGFVDAVAANGPLNDAMSREQADATACALAGPDTHRLLTQTLGWTLEQYTDWLDRAMVALLLPPS